jgi:SAM-dependent methyltransferase
MLKRLIKFYHNSYPNTAESTMSDIWKGITTVRQGSLKNALTSGDESLLEKTLDGWVVSKGAEGVEYSPDVYSLSRPGLDRSKLTDRELSIPDPSGLEPAPTGSGHVAQLLCRVNNGIPSHTLELGAGLGFIGVIMCRWGAKSYTDVDLSTYATAAAFFFSRCCGAERVRLRGEPDSKSIFATYYPSTDCSGVLERKYDAVVNVNSFPEMPNSAQDSYLRIIAKCLKPGGFFFSINHEHEVCGQRSLTHAIAANPGLLILQKRNQSEVYPSWYNDEVYRIA